MAQTALEKGSNLKVVFEGKEISQSLTTHTEIISAANELIDSYLRVYHPDIVVNRKKYSLQSEQTDTPEFKRWFGDSPFVNEDGSPKVYYHGTPYGGFNVFKNWSYFTDNKEYADKYHNPSASSIRGRYNPATQEKTYDVYLTAKKEES